MSKNNVQDRVVAWFERDRSYLISLFEDLRERSKRPPSVPSFSELGVIPLIQEMNQLKLCSRLGLPDAFVHWDHTREDRSLRVVEHVYGTNDPDGGWDSTICVHREDGIPSRKRLNWSLHLWEVRKGAATIEDLSARWIRKLQRLRAPSIYPALPLARMRNAPEDLSRDPLWSQLDEACAELARPENLLNSAWSVETNVPWVHALNALVMYDMNLERGIFGIRTAVGGKQMACVVAHPGKGAALDLPFVDRGRLDAEQLEKMRARLLMWQELRRKQLVEIYGRARTAKTARSGRPPTDPRRDAQIWEMRKTVDLSIAEIANKLGVNTKEVKRAIDRERKRRER